MKKLLVWLLLPLIFMKCGRNSKSDDNDLLLGLAFLNANQSQNRGTIAFVSGRAGDFDEIFFQGLDDSRIVRVTENDGNDFAPRWNLKGDKLVWNSRRSAVHGHNRPEIYLQEFPSQEIKRITDTPAPNENQRASFFPDDSAIVFQRGTYFLPARLAITKHNLSTRKEEVLFEGGDKLHAAPAISRDGKKMVFQSNKDFPGFFPSRLYLMDMETREVENLVHPEENLGSDLDPRWSPDGRYIVFSSARNGGGDYNHLFIVNTATKELEQITTGDFYDSSPDFSPNGREIVFQSDRVEDSGIHIINLQTKEVRYIGEGRTPVWSSRTLSQLGF